MKLLNLARDTLLKPLQAVTGIVERRNTLPILSNVLLEVDGDEVHVRMRIEAELPELRLLLGLGGGVVELEDPQRPH